MKKIVLASLIAFSFGSAMAAERYAGVGVGRAQQKLSADSVGISMSATSVKVFGGFQFDNNFGIEAGYTDFGKAVITGDGATASLATKSFYAAATRRSEIAPGLVAYGKLGVARPGTKGSFSDGVTPTQEVNTRRSTLMAAVGATFAVTKEVALFTEYEYYGKPVKENAGSLKLDHVSFGLRYNF